MTSALLMGLPSMAHSRRGAKELNAHALGGEGSAGALDSSGQ